jgi:ABC-type transport system involved in multi-copper enzyme maturation permease subunit
MIDVMTLTANELTRRRFVAGAVIATSVLIALTGWGFSYLPHLHARNGVPVSHQHVLEMSSALVILIAYLFSFLLAMAAVFISAPSFANDIESGVLLPVLVRPISRTAILIGKALALAIVIGLYAVITGACEFAVVRVATGYLPPHPASALGYLALSGVVMVALAILLSTRMSAIGASIVAVVAFIIARLGGIAQSIGMYYDNETVRHAGTITQLLLPSDAMWQSALYRMEPAALVAGFQAGHIWPGPFFVLAPPPLALVAWTFLWIVAIGALAARSFALRDL